jgi:hypothetical protein
MILLASVAQQQQQLANAARGVVNSCRGTVVEEQQKAAADCTSSSSRVEAVGVVVFVAILFDMHCSAVVNVLSRDEQLAGFVNNPS